MTGDPSENIYGRGRSPNETIDIQDIISSWDTPGAPFLSAHMIAETGVSASGSISWQESPDNLTAPTLPGWYPKFESFIEPGARALCRFFVQECGWITYTSCEGHRDIATSTPRSLRHVGLLPRSSEEYDRIHRFLIASVSAFRDISPRLDHVHLAILKHQLMDPCRSQDVLDLEFSPTGAQDVYFAQLDTTVARYLVCAGKLIRRGESDA